MEEGGFSPRKDLTDTFSKWNKEKSSLFVVDINGDSLPDLLGFHELGVTFVLNQGETFGTPVKQDIFKWVYGSTIRYPVDMNGDGYLDIAGFDSDGFHVGLGDGEKFGAPVLWDSNFTAVTASQSYKNPRIISDINADGLADIIHFENGGVHASINMGAIGCSAAGTPCFEPKALWLAGLNSSEDFWSINKSVVEVHSTISLRIFIPKTKLGPVITWRNIFYTHTFINKTARFSCVSPIAVCHYDITIRYNILHHRNMPIFQPTSFF